MVQFNSVISPGDHNTGNSDSNEGCKAKKKFNGGKFEKKNWNWINISIVGIIYLFFKI